jgi:phospholipid/cholesterol/gamma-HCH transport system substrate-binding protein
MRNSFKNFLIGLFLLGAMGLFAGLVMFLRPSVGDQKQMLHVRFANVNKVNVGTRVLFAGKAVGTVTAVREIYHARETQPTDELGRQFFYELTLKIDSKVHVYSTDEISIQTSGLLGEKSIAIIPKAPPKGITPEMITDKTPIYASSVDPLENTISRFSEVSDKLNDTVGMVKSWFELNQEQLSSSIGSFGSAMSEIHTATRTINEQQIIPQLKEGSAAMTASMQKIDAALDQLHEQGVFENFGPAIANMKTASAHLGQISQDIAGGQGTLGKLVKDSDMYLRMTAVMSKVDTLMNDVNHYGVLFHLNKSWQRGRTKRASTLTALETPDAFKGYFQTEVDQINTAMARLSMLIDKAQDTDKIDPAKFKDNFAELMRQVDEMSNNLRLYNEQLNSVKE